MACLQQVAAALSSRIKRPTDLVARYGGEEFVALLPDTDLGGATALAEELREARLPALAIVHGGCSLGRISVSIGVADEVPSSGGGAPRSCTPPTTDSIAPNSADATACTRSGTNRAAKPPRPRRMAARNNLPVALTRLIGRRQEIGQARALLAHHRLVSIVGTGGTGKTRAAIAVADRDRRTL